jgi:uncharacterized Tic20 family protein
MPVPATPIPAPLAPKPALVEIVLAVVAHLCAFVAPFLGPLLIWLVTRKRLPFAAQHARAVLVTHLLACLALAVLGGLAVVVLVVELGGPFSFPPKSGQGEGWFLVFVLLVGVALLAWVVNWVSSVHGAVAALRGRSAHRRVHDRR